MNDIRLKILQMITDKLGVNKTQLADNTLFYDDLDVDSLDFCELVVDIEDTFNITIEDEYYSKIKTVGTLINFVEHKIEHMPEEDLLHADIDD